MTSREITRVLAHEIESGAYAAGDAFPTRVALAGRFGVAQATVDHAVRALVNRGMVQRRRGAGSVVINTSRVLEIAFIGYDPTLYDEPSGHEVAYKHLSFATVATRSARNSLLDVDGIIWSKPEQEALQWVHDLQGQIPQIVLNRTPPALDYVSTDHTGAVYQITLERLKAHPGWLPVFLSRLQDNVASVGNLRREGFVKACRECNTFYEELALPADFEATLAILRANFDTPSRKRLVMVSAYRCHTGAVAAWVRESGRRWRKDILYSDFDNDFDESVWGVRVTTFIQDYRRMCAQATQGLVDLVHGKTTRIQILQPPLRCDGNT